MRVVLYNMRYGAGAGWRFNLPLPGAGYLKDASRNLARIGDCLGALRPDLVALLEVDGGSRRAPDPQHTALAGKLGVEHAFRCKYATGSLAARLPLFRAQGNAVLSRRPLAALRFHDLSAGTKRLVIEAETDQLTLFVAHLALRPGIRRRQLRDLADLIRAARSPAVLAGDLNTLMAERELRPLLEATGLRPADHQLPPSWPAARPRLALDHILIAPELGVSRIEVLDVRLSDHRPVVCDLVARA